MLPIALKPTGREDDGKGESLYYAVKQGYTLDFYTKEGINHRLRPFDHYTLQVLSSKVFEEKNIAKSPQGKPDEIVFQSKAYKFFQKTLL